MSYSAYIARVVNTRPHPDADRIKLGTILGHQVVIGLDTPEGELGIFFPTDGQLSKEYTDANDLVGVYENGKKVSGGFFSKKRRVRSQNFRGQKSEGYFAPLTSLRFTGADITKLKDGDTLTELNGVPICNKYFTPATMRNAKGESKRNRRETPMFKQHFDTAQFRFRSRDIKPGSLITITEKVHGTSGRYGHVLDERPLTTFQKLKAKLGFNVEAKEEWTYLMGTRRVIKRNDDEGYYGSDAFRYTAVEPLKNNLHKGEVVYFEIVGYTDTGQLIMPSVKTSSLPDVEAAYGAEMIYKYGCTPPDEPGPTNKIYIYRIVNVSVDGEAVDLSWAGVKRRCLELGVEYTPEFVTNKISEDTQYDLLMLQTSLEKLAVGSSTIDPTHLREGVCLRADSGDATPLVLKLKSYEFGVLEGYLKLDDNYVDMEEAS